MIRVDGKDQTRERKDGGRGEGNIKDKSLTARRPISD